jgi:hypothetical protein
VALPRRGRTGLAAFVGYLGIAFLFLGLPLLSHPESTVVGDRYSDPQIFIWSFAWFPHALLHGENPFVTHAIWAPSGFDLAWATSVPALAVAFAPLTLAFGAIFSFDAACIVVAALDAWAAFLLCRALTGRLWPSLLGGYLFGFSSYVLAAELDHLHTAAVFVLPLAALCVLRHLEGRLSGRRLAVELGLLVALQAYLAVEILFTATCALLAGLVLAFALVPGVRARVARIAVPLAGAYALAGVLAAPLLYFMLSSFGSRPPAGAETYVSDAANLVVPTNVSFGGWWSAGVAAHFPGNDIERGAYLGLPALVIVAWFLARRWRTPAARFLGAALVLALLASFGSWLTVDGHRLVSLPWLHLAARPLFDDVMPARLAVYVALAAAATVACWAASTLAPARVRVALAVLAVLTVAPNFSWKAWAARPEVPHLFTSALVRACIPRGANVLALPFGPRGDSLLWQEESGFWFRIAGGYISPAPPAQFSAPPSVQRIAADDLPPKVTVASLRLFVRAKAVSVVVLDARAEPFWRPLLRELASPQAVGGALVYRLDGAAAPAGCAAAS